MMITAENTIGLATSMAAPRMPSSALICNRSPTSISMTG